VGADSGSHLFEKALLERIDAVRALPEGVEEAETFVVSERLFGVGFVGGDEGRNLLIELGGGGTRRDDLEHLGGIAGADGVGEGMEFGNICSHAAAEGDAEEGRHLGEEGSCFDGGELVGITEDDEARGVTDGV